MSFGSEKPKPEISVFMPARNEEGTILQNLRVLKKAIREKQIARAVVVLDGPADRTPEIVFKELGLKDQKMPERRKTMVLPKGFILICHPEPMGKGRSWMEAMFTLKGRVKTFMNPNSVVVNLDADTIKLTAEPITWLAEDLLERRAKNKAGKEFRAPMIVGTAFEGASRTDMRGCELHPDSNGFRAIRARALKRLFRFHKDWVRSMPEQFALEYALNRLFYGHGKPPQSAASVYQIAPYRHATMQAQYDELARAAAYHNAVLNRGSKGVFPRHVPEPAFREKIKTLMERKKPTFREKTRALMGRKMPR